MKINMRYIGLFGAGFAISAAIVLFSCQKGGTNEAQQIVDKAIQANGANLFASKKVSFTFRNKEYSAKRLNGDYIYSRSFQDSTGMIEDQLINSSEFTRTLNGEEVSLSEEWRGRYGNSVNSVLYFVEILYRLNDAAVNKTYEGTESIRGEVYHIIKVTFGQENGGEDFQDEYRYWIHSEDYTLDYLAYNYLTDGGGVRFREAYDREVIGGITFQNYVNLKPASKETPLSELGMLFEKGELEKLSYIVNDDIKVVDQL